MASAAYHETMAELLDELGVDEAGVMAFDRMDESLLRLALQKYVANVVLTRLLRILSIEIEHGARTAARAVQVELDIRDYVDAAVQLDFASQSLAAIDWNSSTAARLIDNLFQQGYEILEAGR